MCHGWRREPPPLPHPPPAKIIASTDTSDASDAIIAELHRNCADQKEAMAALATLLNTMLTQTIPGVGTGTGGGGGVKNATKERKPDPKARKWWVYKKMVRHKDYDWWENEKNASTRPSWWKPSM